MMETIGREIRVALSRKAQPIWFRIVKWVIAIGLTVLLWGTQFFWWWIIGAVLASLVVHFTWRWKTQGWTRPWGGWNDIAAGRK